MTGWGGYFYSTVTMYVNHCLHIFPALLLFQLILFFYQIIFFNNLNWFIFYWARTSIHSFSLSSFLCGKYHQHSYEVAPSLWCGQNELHTTQSYFSSHLILMAQQVMILFYSITPLSAYLYFHPHRLWH